MNHCKKVLSILLVLAIVLITSCSPSQRDDDPDISERIKDRVQGITSTSGECSFYVFMDDDDEVQIKVIVEDKFTCQVIEGIAVELIVTEDTLDVLLYDPLGNYLPEVFVFEKANLNDYPQIRYENPWIIALVGATSVALQLWGLATYIAGGIAILAGKTGVLTVGAVLVSFVVSMAATGLLMLAEHLASRPSPEDKLDYPVVIHIFGEPDGDSVVNTVTVPSGTTWQDMNDVVRTITGDIEVRIVLPAENPVGAYYYPDGTPKVLYVYPVGQANIQPFELPPAEPAVWPMFGRNPQRTGRSIYNGPEVWEPKWFFATGGWPGHSIAIGTDGTVYVPSQYRFYAIDPDGTEKWSFANQTTCQSAPAIAGNGTIYVGSTDHKLYAMTPDGIELWSFTTTGQLQTSPVIGVDGTIYIGSSDPYYYTSGRLHAINPDGSLKWSSGKIGAISRSSPAIGYDGTIYVGSINGKLYAFNPNGTQKWVFTTGLYIYSAPAIATDGTIYVGSYDRKLYAVNPNGTEKWSFVTGDNIYSSPAIGADGIIYVGSRDGKLYAVNPDGTEKWSFVTTGFVYSSPAIGADGTIYVGSNNGKLYAISPDGTERWSFTTGDQIDSSPAIGPDGTIYVGSRDGNLYAIGEAASSS